MADQPNILFVMTDQHHFECLGCLGHPLLKTPHLDRLAGEGITFTNAYTPSPVCSPARGALFSGCYPPGSGVVTNWAPFNAEAVLLPEHMQNSGYLTAAVGKLHFVPHLKRFGFAYKRLHDAPCNVYADDAEHSDYIRFLRRTLYRDNPRTVTDLFDDDELQYPGGDLTRFVLGGNFIPESHHVTTWTADESIRLLREQDGRQPFFLFASFFGPHQPWAPPGRWATMYDPGDVALPPQFDALMDDNPVFEAVKGKQSRRNRKFWSRADYRSMIAQYLGSISMIDHAIGRIFDVLRERGLWEDTLVVFTSDHGDHQGRYGLFFKGDMYDSAARVPLVIKPAGASSPGLRCDSVVNILDLYGTLLDAAGNGDWRGTGVEAGSLANMVANPARWADTPGQAFGIHGRDSARSQAMLRRGPLKLIRLARGAEAPLYEMYDLRDRVPEVRNVYDDPGYRNERDALRSELDAWWQRQAERYPSPVRTLERPRG